MNQSRTLQIDHTLTDHLDQVKSSNTFSSRKQRWLKSSGFWWDETAIALGAVFPGQGDDASPRVGVRALRDLAVGEIVARMPTARCFTRLDCTHSETVAKIRASIGDEKEWLAELGAALLLERLNSDEDSRCGGNKNQRSALAGYIASLPQREEGVVASWPDCQKAFLVGTDVDRALRDERSAARTEWDRHVYPQIWQFTDANGDPPSFASYLDARSVVSSRAFSVTTETGPGLVPIADLFNHKTGGHHVTMRLVDEVVTRSGDETETDEIKNSSFLRKNSKTLVAEITAAVASGDEIFNTYGGLGNAILLNSFGFCQACNPEDTVTFSVPDLRAAAALCQVPGSLIKKRIEECIALHAFTETEMFALKNNQPPPDGLLLALWAVTASEEGFFRVKEYVEAENSKDISQTRVDFENSRETDSAKTWRSAAEVFLNPQAGPALSVFAAILKRRLGMYARPPIGGGGEETASWISSLKTLVDSERAIIETHLAQTIGALRNLEGDAVTKRRKTQSRSPPTTKQDAFALFD